VKSIFLGYDIVKQLLRVMAHEGEFKKGFGAAKGILYQ